jgi:hypothetical protein
LRAAAEHAIVRRTRRQHVVAWVAVIVGFLVVVSPSLSQAEPAAPRPATAAPNHELDLVLKGTVTKIKTFEPRDELSQKHWAVTVKVKRVITGSISEPTLTFAVHSPAMSGLKVGRSYTIKATRTADGYLVDELQWRRP